MSQSQKLLNPARRKCWLLLVNGKRQFISPNLLNPGKRGPHLHLLESFSVSTAKNDFLLRYGKCC